MLLVSMIPPLLSSRICTGSLCAAGAYAEDPQRAWFEVEREEQLVRLHAELEWRIYHPSRSVSFVVAHTMFREIFAADFRDRVGHHVVVEALEGSGNLPFSMTPMPAGKARGPTGRRWQLKRL